MPEPELVVYRVDGEDRLSFLDEAWDRFAAENQAPELTRDKVLRRSLWEFIPDAATRGIYQDIVARARKGRVTTVPFRCDAPGRRRFLELEIRALPDGAVEFRSKTLRIEPREPAALLSRDTPRSGESLKMCAWCKKMPVGGEWVEVEEAAARLRLFERPRLPLLSHGMCPACEEEMNRRLDG